MVPNSHSVLRHAREPIVVAPLALSALVGAGLHALLRPYSMRVRLLPPARRGPYDVGLVEPELLDGNWHPPLDHPVVALAHHRLAAGGDATWGGRFADVVGIDASADELVRRLERVHRRGCDAHVHSEPCDGDLLSCREAEIVARICRGVSNQEIAAELFLSLNSVKSYIRSAYRKMGVSSRIQAVLWGLEHGYGAEHPQESSSRDPSDDLTPRRPARPVSGDRAGSAAVAAIPASG